MGISNSSKWLKKERVVAELIVIIIIAILLFAFFAFKKTPSELKEKVSEPSMSFRAYYRIFKEGYTTPVVEIENLNNHPWEDCEVKINDDYKVKIEIFPPVSSGENMQTVQTINFIREDGVKFDYTLSGIKTMCISCFKPHYNMFCGKFVY